MPNTAYHLGLLIVSTFVIVQCVAYYILYIGPQYADSSGSTMHRYITSIQRHLHEKTMQQHSTNHTSNVSDIERRIDGTVSEITDDHRSIPGNGIRAGKRQTLPLKGGGSLGTEDCEQTKNDRTRGESRKPDQMPWIKHTDNTKHRETMSSRSINSRNKPTSHIHIAGKKEYRIVWFKVRSGYYSTMKTKVNLTQCEYNDCTMEYIQAYQDYDLKVPLKADAVVFQGNQIMTKYPPVRSHPDQVFIFFDMESPPYIHYTRYKSPPWNGVFNWTLTYRPDSDFFNPYGLPVMRPVGGGVPHTHYTSTFRHKTKTAVWIVSHCHAQSKREDYVRKLAEYIDIDIIGLCGKKLPFCSKSKSKECLPELLKPYKFYLAFENNFCKGYITEKFYKTLEFDIIPVVRGGADYKSLAPPGTFINTADFNTVKDLANHLKHVGSSEEKYTAFLKAKHGYTGSTSAYQRSFCEMCKRLRDVDTYRKSYSDIRSWWWANNTCKTASDIV